MLDKLVFSLLTTMFDSNGQRIVLFLSYLIFSNPIHPYTKSLLSAIPHPNPGVEKNRISLTYDYKSSGIDYSKGTEHLIEGTHSVLGTDEELAQWLK